MFTIFSRKISEKQLLIAILLLGALLRFWGLGSAEFFHDEGFKAFRSIGYLDYIQNDNQTAPVQWFNPAPFKECGAIFDSYLEQGKNYEPNSNQCPTELFNKYRFLKGAGFKDDALPWWTSLSFHDHPPLFFLVQHLFFKIFGDSLFIARLPSAISGILAIYLVYLIVKRFFQNPIAPLFAAFLLSINLIHIWLSRSSLMEAFQVFLILFNIYYFFQFLDDRRHWRPFGLTLGLAFLAKYTSAFLAPVYFSFIFFLEGTSMFRRETTERRFAWFAPQSEAEIGARGSPAKRGSFRRNILVPFCFALGLAAILFSPVLIYNFYLWQAIGHFDLQFSYLFRQSTPEWQALLGKIQDPFSEILNNLTLMYSIPFLLAALAGIGYAIYEIYKSIKRPYLIFWLLNFIFITLMLVKVGSAFRFIVLYAVPAVMLITYLFDYLFSKFQKEILFRILLIAFLAYELFFALGIFYTFPNFGITQLDQYLDSELGNKRSLSIPASSNPHLNKIIRYYALKIPPADNPIMIIYDENVGLSPRLWLFTRRNYYHGIPAVTVDQFKKFLQEQGSAGFRGYNLYFIKASDKTYLNPLFFNPSAQELEVFLRGDRNLNPAKEIYGYNNLLMFTVYKFTL